jgi:hypothetical protein
VPGLDPGEREQPTGEDPGLIDGRGGVGDRVAALGVEPGGARHVLEHAPDDGEEVVEVVRDAAGEPPERFELLRLTEALLQLPVRRVVDDEPFVAFAVRQPHPLSEQLDREQPPVLPLPGGLRVEELAERALLEATALLRVRVQVAGDVEGEHLGGGAVAEHAHERVVDLQEPPGPARPVRPDAEGPHELLHPLLAASRRGHRPLVVEPDQREREGEAVRDGQGEPPRHEPLLVTEPGVVEGVHGRGRDGGRAHVRHGARDASARPEERPGRDAVGGGEEADRADRRRHHRRAGPGGDRRGHEGRGARDPPAEGDGPIDEPERAHEQRDRARDHQREGRQPGDERERVPGDVGARIRAHEARCGLRGEREGPPSEVGVALRPPQPEEDGRA